MRENEVRKLLEENNRTWEDFCKIEGQTMAMYEDGETDYYEDDVERFIKRNENSFTWD
jgi:hypothetical protein